VVAGTFYPKDPAALTRMIDDFIAAAPRHELPEPLLGLMVPHAGYRYSGEAAAHGYRSVQGRAVRLVVLMAPSHRVPAPYAATLDRSAYRIPLGEVPLARAEATRLVESSRVVRFDERLFVREHSLEVQLPFVARVFSGVPVLPLVVGSRSPTVAEGLAQALHGLLGARQDVLVLASSDLSHHLPYDECKRVDARTLKQVTRLDAEALLRAATTRQAQLCGAAPVAVLSRLLRLRGGSSAKLLFHNNSGDTAGGKEQVVGYAVVAFGGNAGPPEGGTAASQPTSGQGADYDLTPAERRWLLGFARRVVEQWVSKRSLPEADPPAGVLQQPGAAFVTLRKGGRLRGCIGHTQPHLPLWQCVRDVASSAATKDRRFPPVSPEELAELTYEVSVLTPLQPLAKPLDVRVGTDGLMVSARGRRGLLLPQVPGEFGWGKQEFLKATCRKAGLPLDCWQQGATFERFQALVFGEAEGEPARAR